MAIAQKVQQYMQAAAWIRGMGGGGGRLMQEHGADNVFDFSLGNPVVEADIEPYDVRAADEAWFTSTTICMVPVTRFDFRPIGNGHPGPVYRQLLDAWSAEVGVDIAGQAREYAERARTWIP